MCGAIIGIIDDWHKALNQKHALKCQLKNVCHDAKIESGILFKLKKSHEETIDWIFGD